MKSKLRPHLFTHDPSVPPEVDLRHPERPGVRFCTCGARETHERHTLPSVPAQAAHRGRYDHEES